MHRCQFQTVRDESSLTDKADENNDSSGVDDTIGRTRDEVAKALRIGSGKQFDRMKTVIKKADELKEQGKDKDAELFLAVLNRSASAAHDLMEIPLESLTDEDKVNIKTGKVAPRQFLQEPTTSKSKRRTSYKKVMDEINVVNQAVRTMKKSTPRVEEFNEQVSIHDSLRDTINELHNLRKCVDIHDDYDDYIDVSNVLQSVVSALIKSIPSSKYDDYLEACKEYAEGQINSLQEFLSVIESKLAKDKK